MNYISIVNEFCQKQKLQSQYKLINQTGPSHAPELTIQLTIYVCPSLEEARATTELCETPQQGAENETNTVINTEENLPVLNTVTKTFVNTATKQQQAKQMCAEQAVNELNMVSILDELAEIQKIKFVEITCDLNKLWDGSVIETEIVLKRGNQKKNILKTIKVVVQNNLDS